MGGAIASHLRLGDPLFTHTLFGVYLGLFLWGGLWLRDQRVRRVVPTPRVSRSAEQRRDLLRRAASAGRA